MGQLADTHGTAIFGAKQDAGTVGSERRPKRRVRVLLSGIATYAEGARTLKCTICDLSETGARIRVTGSDQLPNHFFLINVRDRLAYQVEAIWRNKAEAGLHFHRIIKLSDIADPELLFLSRIWHGYALR